MKDKEIRFTFYGNEKLEKAIIEYQAKNRIFNRSEVLRRIIVEFLKKEGLLKDDK